MLRAALAGILLFPPVSLPAQALPPPRKIQVSEGIYLFITAPYSDAGLDGNSIAILSPDGVLVFDSNGTPAAASTVLAGIRAMTGAPVRYLVNSHWHWDHWYGAEVYRQAFPGLQIITHEKSRQMMMGPERVFNKPGLDEKELMTRLTHGDPNLNRQFKIYLVDWFMHRVYDELDGRLSDEIMVPKH